VNLKIDLNMEMCLFVEAQLSLKYLKKGIRFTRRNEDIVTRSKIFPYFTHEELLYNVEICISS
jgi:hypothetical protein